MLLGNAPLNCETEVSMASPGVFKPVLEAPQHCRFCLPYLTHLFQLISSLVETAKPELGVSDKGDVQNMQCLGASRTVLKTSGLGHTEINILPHVTQNYSSLYSTTADLFAI